MVTDYGPSLYGVLCSRTGGEANSVVRSISANMLPGSGNECVKGERCGFKAFHALNHRFNPKPPARMLQFLTQVVSPAPVKNVKELPAAIEKWEMKRALLSNEFQENVSEKLATAILVSILPNELKDIVFQSQEPELQYGKVGDKVISLAGYRIRMASPTPMDIGAVNNYSGHCNHNHDETWHEDFNREWNPELEIGQVKGSGKGNMQ